jgi:spheroidene monooxygenase
MFKLTQAAGAPSGAAAALPLRRAAEAQAAASPVTGSSTRTSGAVAGPVAALLLADVAPAARLWGWSRIVRGSRPLRREPGLRWARVMGSGEGGGFGLRPSWSHQGVFAVFDDLDAAQAFVQCSPCVAAYRERSAECLTALLQPWSARGRWGGQGLEVPALATAPQGPVVGLTRASIKPLKAWPVWAMAPAAQASLLQAPGCTLAAGLGEAPLLRQCTVSLWDSVAAMDAYARSGAHLAAVRAAAAHGFFSESMFLRFRLLAIEGRWQGRQHG